MPRIFSAFRSVLCATSSGNIRSSACALLRPAKAARRNEPSEKLAHEHTNTGVAGEPAERARRGSRLSEERRNRARVRHSLHTGSAAHPPARLAVGRFAVVFDHLLDPYLDDIALHQKAARIQLVSDSAADLDHAE